MKAAMAEAQEKLLSLELWGDMKVFFSEEKSRSSQRINAEGSFVTLESTSPHMPNFVATKLKTLGFHLVSKPFHSPDLALSHYFLSSDLKKHWGHWNAKEPAENWLWDQSKNFYLTGAEKLQQRWNKNMFHGIIC